MVRFKIYKYALVFVFFLLSCTPQKRLARILDKHPYLIEQRDTFTVRNTVIRPGIKHDTLFFPIAGKRDTFIIRNERGVTNLYINEDNTEARVNQEIKSDTTVSTNTTVTNTVDTYEERAEKWIWKIVGTLAGFVVLIYVMRMIERRFAPRP